MDARSAILVLVALAALLAGGLLVLGGGGEPEIRDPGPAERREADAAGPSGPVAEEGGSSAPISPSLFQGDDEPAFRSGDGDSAEAPEGRLEPRVLRCVVLDSSGRPLPGATVEVAVEAPSQLRKIAAATDGEGVLRFPWRGPPWQPGTSRSIGLELIEREVAVASARLDASREFPDGESDLGSVVMIPLPRLASGIVVDEDGKPIPGAQVQLLWRPVADRHLAATEGWDFSGVPPQRAREDGTFDLRGSLDPGDLMLMVHHSSVYLPDTAGPLAFGATGVVATLKRSFSFKGRVLLPEGAPPDQVLVRLAKDPPAPATYSVAPGKDGVFQVPWMSRGTGRLDVSLARMWPADVSEPEPFSLSARSVESLEMVAIEPPGEGEEGWLVIDLRHRLKAIAIEVRPSDPALAIEEARIAVTDAQGARGTFEAPGGKCIVVAAELPLSLSISSPGFLDRTAGGVHGNVAVALDRGSQLEVRVLLPGPLPDGASEMDVRAIVADGDIPRVDGRARCDEYGVARLAVGTAGPVTLQASVLLSGPSRGSRVDLGPAVAADSGGAGDVRIVDLPVRPEDLEDFRKRVALRSRPR